MNELSIVAIMTVIGFLWATMCYAVGFKEGERIGFRKGRELSRRISEKVWE